MQHYGTNSSIGTQLTTSLELLQLETGYNDNPLNHPCHPMGPLCTPCWFRSLWEAVDHFKFRIVLDYPTQQEPRENDTLLISLFNAWTNEMQSRRSLNRCRIVWNAIFLSDVATANGRQVEHHMTQPPTSKPPPRSIFDFQEQRPTATDWEVWKRFWEQYTLQDHTFHKPLGEWVHTTHREWEWYCNETESVVERSVNSNVDTYHLEPTSSARRTPLFIKISSRTGAISPHLLPCSIIHHENASIRLRRPGPRLFTLNPTVDDFWEFLGKRGGRGCGLK